MGMARADFSRVFQGDQAFGLGNEGDQVREQRGFPGPGTSGKKYGLSREGCASENTEGLGVTSPSAFGHGMTRSCQLGNRKSPE